MTGTCLNCKWWKHDDKETAYAPGDHAMQLIPAKPCTCPQILDVSAATNYEGGWFSVAVNGAGYSDSEGFAAEFRTGPHFGCIHHALSCGVEAKKLLEGK